MFLPSLYIVDGILVFISILFASVTLTYPFGADQGIYYYIGREWFHGLMPYRDMIDQKTPLIYLIYGLTTVIFGETLWGIRLIEIVWVILVGYFIGSLGALRSQKPAPGARGLAILTTTIFYFGHFNFWDSAQTELYYSGLSMLSFWAVRRIHKPSVAFWTGGLLGGLAILMKPVAIFLLLVAIIGLIERSYDNKASALDVLKRLIKNCLYYALGVAIPLLLCIGYFAAAGALGDMIDLVVFANQHYLRYEPGVKNVQGILQRTTAVLWVMKEIFLVLAVISATAFLLSILKKSETAMNYCFGILLILAAYSAICIQGKFYFYHWGVIVFPVAGMAAIAFEDLASARLSPFSRQLQNHKFIAPLLMGILLLGGYSYGFAYPFYMGTVKDALKYLSGKTNREEYINRFTVPVFNYHWAVDEAVGKWINANGNPDDLIAVRGFRPGIYAVAHRRAPTRFFWTSWLTDSRRTYRRKEWLAEDLAAIRKSPPRYVVILNRVRYGPDSFFYFWSMGYRKAFEKGELSVLER